MRSFILRSTVVASLAAMVAARGGGGGGESDPVETGSGKNTTVVSPPIIVPLQTYVPTPTYSQDSGLAQDFNILNDALGRCGFGLVKQNAALDVAAANHVNYVVEIFLDISLINKHREILGLQA